MLCSTGSRSSSRVRYLELDDYLVIAENVLDLPAEDLVRFERVVPLAESALNAPRAGFGGVEAYVTLPMKAAVLCSRLARNHPLPDGNKRCAYLALLMFLALNGLTWMSPGDDETAEMIENVAAGKIDEVDLAAWIDANST